MRVSESLHNGHLKKNRSILFRSRDAINSVLSTIWITVVFVWFAAGNERAERKTWDRETRLDRKLHEKTGEKLHLYRTKTLQLEITLAFLLTCLFTVYVYFQDAVLMAKERELKDAVREGRDRVSEETLVCFFRILYFAFWWPVTLFGFTLLIAKSNNVNRLNNTKLSNSTTKKHFFTVQVWKVTLIQTQKFIRATLYSVINSTAEK